MLFSFCWISFVRFVYDYLSGAISIDFSAPRASSGYSSFIRGLAARALLRLTSVSGLLTVRVATVASLDETTDHASSGNCSFIRGLAARAVFSFTTANARLDGVMASLERGDSVTLRVSQGNSSFARGLAATARLFITSLALNNCPTLVVAFSVNAAAVTASRYSLFFVFMFFSFGCGGDLMRRRISAAYRCHTSYYSALGCCPRRRR